MIQAQLAVESSYNEKRPHPALLSQPLAALILVALADLPAPSLPGTFESKIFAQ